MFASRLMSLNYSNRMKCVCAASHKTVIFVLCRVRARKAGQHWFKRSKQIDILVLLLYKLANVLNLIERIKVCHLVVKWFCSEKRTKIQENLQVDFALIYLCDRLFLVVTSINESWQHN
jgi:hypothetical protein